VATPPLTQPQLEAILDQALDVELSFRNTEGPAQRLARLPRTEQELVLELVRRLASTHVELGYQIAEQAPQALAAMDERGLTSWALHAADVYDRVGLRPALLAIREVERFLREGAERAAGVVLEEEGRVLLPFLNGLEGRRLQIEQGEEPWTDTEVLYLPAVVAHLPSREENFLIYKVMVTQLWAQVRYGTFRAALPTALAASPTPERLLGLFQACEETRLGARLARELPGLQRDLTHLRQRLAVAPPSAAWQTFTAPLQQADASAEDSLLLACSAALHLVPPAPAVWCGRLQFDAARDRMAARVEREKALFRLHLANLLEEMRQKGALLEHEPRFTTRQRDDTPESLELILDEIAVPLPAGVRRLASSILLDLSAIPPDYLVPAGPGEYDPKLYREEQPDLDNLWEGTYHEIGAHLYDEWDYQRRHYRKRWCAVRERTLNPVHNDFVALTLARHGPLIRQLRRTFEGLRGEDKVLKRQAEGEEIDFDALVESLADHHDGRELSDRLYAHRQRLERNIAVAFLVDMSGSTRGWINDAEREALLLLCEALESLGDRYAVYGFSGQTRKRCEIYPVKRFDEPYDAAVQGRISAIAPQDYTRMGFAIRHMIQLLRQQEVRTRLLVTLSDGKPDDYSDYRGEYGIEDTRQALIEAKRAGIHPFCITLDREGSEYLSHMYGAVNWVLVDEVRKLPLKVADIYRRLTT